MKKQYLTLLVLLVAATALTVGCGNSNTVPTFKQIAFHSDRTSTPATPLFIMNLDGSGVTPVPFSSSPYIYSPTISADLKTVVFTSQGNIWVSDAAGAHQTQLTTFDDSTKWSNLARVSPNGKQIVYAMYDSSVGNDAIWIMNTDGTAAVNLTATMPTGMTDCYVATFSADSSQVAFACWGSSNYGLFTVKADGTGLTTVTTQTFYMDSPSFSPDGKQLYFVQYTGCSSCARNLHARSHIRGAIGHTTSPVSTSGITSVNLDGSNMTVVLPASNLWEVEILNSTMYYTIYDSNLSLDQVYKANLDGSSPVSLSDGTSSDYLGVANGD